MELRSMTGFGRGKAKGKGLCADVEISSVNRRQLDIRTSLPRGSAVLESRLHEQIRAAIGRGAVSVLVRIETAPGGSGLMIDETAAMEYARKLRSLGRKLGTGQNVTLDTLVALPGVVRSEAFPDDPERLWPLVRRATGAALGAMAEMKAREGRTLGKDVRRRMERLDRIRKRIESLAGRSVARSRAAIAERLTKAGVDLPPDDPSLVREVALLADKGDVSEEVVRLGSHIEQTVSLLAGGGAVGRTLDFVCQEMFREINTIGSKSGDAVITRSVIEFKSLLETVREQVQNLE
jgi:uncharacterized protein (TIGR00255 family)